MRNPLTASDCFEENAGRFYVDTRLLAPGKSWPLEMPCPVSEAELKAKWDEWKVENYKCICNQPKP